jgi:hypothetical protein
VPYVPRPRFARVLRSTSDAYARVARGRFRSISEFDCLCGHARAWLHECGCAQLRAAALVCVRVGVRAVPRRCRFVLRYFLFSSDQA